MPKPLKGYPRQSVGLRSGEPDWFFATAIHRKKEQAQDLSFFLVEIVGLEPMTFCMSSKRSNQLSYTSVLNSPYQIQGSRKVSKNFWGKGATCVKGKQFLFLKIAANGAVLRRGGAAGTCTPVLRSSDVISTYIVNLLIFPRVRR